MFFFSLSVFLCLSLSLFRPLSLSLSLSLARNPTPDPKTFGIKSLSPVDYIGSYTGSSGSEGSKFVLLLGEECGAQDLATSAWRTATLQVAKPDPRFRCVFRDRIYHTPTCGFVEW